MVRVTTGSNRCGGELGTTCCWDLAASLACSPAEGASPAAIAELERGLSNLATVNRHVSSFEIRNQPGAGASGGRPARIPGRTAHPRFEVLTRLPDFDGRLDRADLAPG